MEKKLKYITILIIVIIIGVLFIHEEKQPSILEVQAQQPQLIEQKIEEVNKVIKSNVQKEKRKEQKIRKEKIKKQKEQKKKKEKVIINNISNSLYTGSQFMSMGVIYWGPYKWTWYSQNVLPGGGLVIPGRHLDEQGYICDGNNYLCLASSTIPKGTVIETPFGKLGKIYDAGCAPGTIDVYVGW